MTSPTHVAVLRNTRCGHVAAIATPERKEALKRQLGTMRGHGWQVAVVANTSNVYEKFMEGACGTCVQA